MNDIEWTQRDDLPHRKEIIPMLMTYRYKTTGSHQVTRKAQCSVRGDLMRPHLHYDPSKVATYMADKTCVRTVLALAAAQDLILGHMDITGAYLHEKYAHTTPVYVWQPKRFDCSYKHRQPAGRLVGNIYGTLPGANIYMTKLHAHLTTGRYQQLKSDPSLFIKRHEHA